MRSRIQFSKGRGRKTFEDFVEVTDPDNYIGAHPAVRLPDGENTSIRVQWLAPLAMQELVSAQVIIVADASGNFARWAHANMGKVCSTEDYNTHEGTISTGVVAITLNALECIDVSGAFSNLLSGDLIGLEFARAGADALDTIDDDCYYLGLRVRWIERL